MIFLPFEESLSIYQYVRKFQAIAWDYFVSIEATMPKTNIHTSSQKYLTRLSDIQNIIIRIQLEL